MIKIIMEMKVDSVFVPSTEMLKNRKNIYGGIIKIVITGKAYKQMVFVFI